MAEVSLENHLHVDSCFVPDPTAKGNTTVKTDPLPASLVTVMSPPITWQNFRLRASPRPVPPYFLDVLESAWVKA